MGAAAHAIPWMVSFAPASDSKLSTMKTLAGLPAIDSSSPRPIPRPIPIARIVSCSTSRRSKTAFSRVWVGLLERPSVKTTRTRGKMSGSRTPLAVVKTDVRIEFRALAVLVPPYLLAREGVDIKSQVRIYGVKKTTQNDTRNWEIMGFNNTDEAPKGHNKFWHRMIGSADKVKCSTIC